MILAWIWVVSWRKNEMKSPLVFASERRKKKIMGVWVDHRPLSVCIYNIYTPYIFFCLM